MDVVTFYAAASALCFTLLGFWWLVVQFRHADLTREAGPRRFSFLVSLHFILPGLASLASLVSSGPLWRLAFAIAGLTGIAAMLLAATEIRNLPFEGVGRLAWGSVPLYVLVVAVAAVPDLARAIGLEPLQAEGYLLLFVILAGILLAWLLFTAPPPIPAREAEADQPAGRAR